MTDRTPDPSGEPVELSWPDRRPGIPPLSQPLSQPGSQPGRQPVPADVDEVAAAARAAAARARAEARLADGVVPDPTGDPTHELTGDPTAPLPVPDRPVPRRHDDPSRRPTAPPPASAPAVPEPPAEPDPPRAVVPPVDGTGGTGGAAGGTRRMVSAAAVMAAGTIASRALGLVRVMLAAYLLGNNSRQAEIWSLASTVPNSLYILLAGGALNTVLVPQIVRAVKTDADGGEAYTNRIMTAFLVLVGAMSVVLVVAAPGIAWIYSDGAWHAPALAPQFASMVLLTALCMPQVFFYGAFFLFGQVLNAREQFGPMMWAPIANNVVAVGVLSLYAAIWGFHGDTSQPFTLTQALLLGLGSVVGIATQTAVLVPYLRKVGFHYRPRFDFRHTGLGHTFHVAKWTLGFVAVNQLALLVVTRLGTSATVGGTGAGMAAYYNANLLWVLPHSLVTVSLATAILPSMSRMAAAHEPSAVGRELERAIRLTTTALVPVSLLYLAIGVPIATLAFRGATKGGDLVGWTLVAFALGLVPFTVQYLVLRGFYAFEDTRATFFLQVVIAGVNAGLAVLFVSFVNPGPNWVAPALALSYTLAYAFGLTLSVRWFRRHVPFFDIAGVGRHVLLVAGAALPATLVAWGIVTLQKEWSTSLPADLLGVAGAGLLAALVYLVMTRVLGVSEVAEVINLVRRRGRRKENAVTDRPDASPAGSAEPDATTVQAAVPSAATAVLPVLDGVATDPDSLAASTASPASTATTATTATTDIVGESDEPADLDTASRLPVGSVLGSRFRLDEELAIRGSTVTWRATDQRLSRSVLVHVLAASDPSTPTVVAAAKQAAQTTDARFLRVLDAVDEPSVDDAGQDGETEGGDATVTPPYIVCEWADGLNLRHLLAAGPLTALESAWLAQQLADALAGTHAHRLYHQRLNPDTVVVTTTGNVKTVGFLIEAALHHRAQGGTSEPPVRPERHEAEDVLALGRILYATLVSRWPGGSQYGLPAAPISANGSWQTPAQVRAGVSPALDRIADRILNPQPQGGEPLRTASRIALELGAVLGTADASHDLERRVRYLLANPQVIASAGGAGAGAAGDGAGEGGGGESSLASQPPSPAHDPSRLQTPVPPPPGAIRSSAPPTTAAPAPRRRPPYVLILAIVVALAVVGGIAATALSRNARQTAGAAAASSASASAATAGPWAITAAKDFDPEADRGNGEENPRLVPLAYDGKPDTAWTTVTYLSNAKMGGLKPGVGVVFDLGKAVPVSAVELLLVGSGTTVDLRVPAKDAPTVTAPPMGAVDQWTVVASSTGAGTSVRLAPQQAVTTRFVLVYLSQLPSLGNNRYQGGIAEITVRP